MKSMKFFLTFLLLFVLAITGCKRTRDKDGNPITNQLASGSTQVVNIPDNEVPAFPPRTIFFEKARFSMKLDNEWEKISTGAYSENSAIVLPVLKGLGKNRGNIIQIFVGENDADIEKSANMIRTNCINVKEVLQDSFIKKPFATKTQIMGEHISYDFQSRDALNTNVLRANLYLFKNKVGKCVAINHTTYADQESSAVDQMVQNTLQLE